MAYPPPPYADAVCGTFVCGEAICGAWWAYPTEPKLTLGAIDPTLIVIAGDIVPPAGLRLGTITPGLLIGSTVVPAPAGLRFGTITPQVAISQTVQIPQALLRLGAIVPDAIGATWLTELDCTDLTLAEDTEGTLVLVAAGSSDLDLDPEECL
jgi:hypothetical protein